MSSEAVMVGRAVRQLRLQWGWSQQELARRCGWRNQSRISHYERAGHEPSLRDIKQLALALQVPPELLVAEAFRAALGGAPAVLTPTEALA